MVKAIENATTDLFHWEIKEFCLIILQSEVEIKVNIVISNTKEKKQWSYAVCLTGPYFRLNIRPLQFSVFPLWILK